MADDENAAAAPDEVLAEPPEQEQPAEEAVPEAAPEEEPPEQPAEEAVPEAAPEEVKEPDGAGPVDTENVEVAETDPPPEEQPDVDADETADSPPAPKEAPEEKKDKGVKQLFSSKGSLMESESFVREKLEEFKEKRAAVAVLIGQLQTTVKEYKEKENPTDDDIANLKKYHTAFLEKLSEYEEMTRNVERLMGMADVPTSQLDMSMSGPSVIQPPKPVVTPAPEKPQRPSQVDTFAEDKLPKLIVCGTDMGDSVPRIIVCEPLRKADMEPFHKTTPQPNGTEGGMMGKINECLETQQKLAAENAQMVQMRHQLQEELLNKQEMMDNMKLKMMTLESERYKMMTENSELQKRLQLTQKPGDPPMCKRELYMKFRGTSPDAASTGCCQLEKPQDLEQELERMDGDVKNICSELESIQREKLSLGYNISCPTSPRKPVCKRMLPQKYTQTDEDKESDVFFESDKDPRYKDLREQYHRLHNDFKNKVTEVASLRVDLERTKTELEDITILHHELEAMHQRELDQNNNLMSERFQIQSYKEQLVDLEQQASQAKQMYKSSQEDMDDMRTLIEDQATQLDEYRNKYMKTLQIAEELKKENEFKERECADQIAVEIQRVKLEMQEQLEELSPIKDLLKITQQKLKETEQMHTIALDTIADMSQKLEDAKNEVDALKVTVSEKNVDLEENLQHSLEVAEKRMTELESTNAHLKDVISQLEGHQTAQSQRLEEKSHELLQMISQLETLREESARQVTRVKERSDMIRKCLQAQIAEMEREVAQCRAGTSFANRERDEIRSKLQLEICLLSENFRESQNRIVQLQQHVNYLSASHPTSLIDLVQ